MDSKDQRSEEKDRHYLRACLDLARLGEGETSPNPMVGALLVKDGILTGQGFHRRAGDPHAEVMALEAAGENARGATLYVNLEPCVHHGRTPPCARAILDAGVSEVVACMQDPDPRVDGRGFRELIEGGVVVREGLLAEESERFNEKFVKFVTRQIPFVTLKAALTLDGQIATASGESKWITSERSRGEVQYLRYQHDAILVGINTVLEDDPELTARHRSGKKLVRVVLDSNLRISPKARLLSNADGGGTLVYALSGAPPEKVSRLRARPGVEVVEVGGEVGGLHWAEVLADLGRRKIASVLVEGGGRILGSALSEGVGDRISLFIAPRILGGEGVAAFSGLSISRLAESLPVLDWQWRALGSDMLVEGYLPHGTSR